MDRKRLTELSKFLSFVLRHEPAAIGIVLDANGWTPIGRLVEACRANGKPLSRELLETIVATSPKQRFAISDDGLRVRANQGIRLTSTSPTSNPTVKHLLYAYRVLLTGIHLMETGEVIANIQLLNQRFRFREIDEMVARKRTGAEKMALDESDMETHGALLDRLETRLSEAHDASHLPDEPTSVAALDDFVVRLRLGSAQSHPKCPISG